MIIYDMPESEYHASSGFGPDKWVTRSVLKSYEDSPSLCRLQLDGEPFAQVKFNTGMGFGNLMEAMLCFPDRLEINEKHKTTGGKAYGEWAETISMGGGVPCVRSDYNLAEFLVARMYESAFGKWFMQKLADGACKFQVVFRWEERGVRCQSMVDALVDDCLPVDIKTGRNPWRKFPTTAHDYGYDIQDVHYVIGLVKNGITLPNITDTDPYGYMPFAYWSTTRPFEARIIRLPAEQRDNASIRRARVLENLSENYWEPQDALIDKPLCPELPAYISMQYGSECDYPGEK
jgi:hypothetical protein